MIKGVIERIRKWARLRRERNDPAYAYLSRATDLVDLEHRMRALRNGEVRNSLLDHVRGF
jgi:hypothetical protein